MARRRKLTRKREGVCINPSNKSEIMERNGHKKRRENLYFQNVTNLHNTKNNDLPAKIEDRRSPIRKGENPQFLPNFGKRKITVPKMAKLKKLKILATFK